MQEGKIVMASMRDVDVLGREIQIETVKKILSSANLNEKGYVLAINGSWGCGKTFFLKELMEELPDSYNFYYDFWGHNYYDEPLIGLLDCLRKELITIIGAKTALSSIAREALEIIKSFFDAFFEKNSLLYRGAKKVLKHSRNKGLFSNDFNAYSKIDSAKHTIVKAIRKLTQKGNKVFICLDELDRCNPQYAMTCLERIHHISNNTQAQIVVAVDKSQLESSIGKAYSSDNANAAHYLRKIVDHVYDLNKGTLSAVNHEKLFGPLEKLFVSKGVMDQRIVLFEQALFRDLDIRRVKKLIDFTITLHKTVFDSKKCSHLIMCGELLLGWGRMIFNDSDDILSSMSKMYYQSINKNCYVFDFIRNNIAFSYKIGINHRGQDIIRIDDLAGFLFYIVHWMNRDQVELVTKFDEKFEIEDLQKLENEYSEFMFYMNV